MKCKNNDCDNDVEWPDEPEDYCRRCVKEFERDYEAFIESEKAED